MATHSRKRALAALLQAFLLGVLIFGVVTGGVSTVVTAVIALVITFVPALLHREFGYSLNPELVLLLTLAVSIHTAGAMGLYGRFTWFDNIAHTVSAMVVAGIGYAAFRALELHSPEIDVPVRFRFLFILVFVLATGVFWEVIEFALGDLMTVYGVNDIVSDMVFNLIGAVIVAVWGTTHLGGLVGFFVRRLRV